MARGVVGKRHAGQTPYEEDRERTHDERFASPRPPQPRQPPPPPDADAEQILRETRITNRIRVGVLVDGALGVELSLVVVADSRCALRLSPAGGSVAWLGGGAGNAAGRFADPCTVQGDSAAARIYLAGLERQDSGLGRALQGKGRAVVAGADLLLPTPPMAC